MQTINVIERAFQIARDVGSVDEIREALKREGYAQVDAHLQGAHIRAQLRSRLDPHEVERRRQPGRLEPA